METWAERGSFRNLVLILLLLAISIPLSVFARDARKTLRRFGIVRSKDDREPVEKYLDRAREVFASDPQVAVYVYGHTHRPSVTELHDRLVINTGTWLKRLHRIDPFLGILPPVYYSSYRLNYFRLSPADDGGILVEYEVIEKSDPKEETRLQRLLARPPKRRSVLPDRTVVSPPGEPAAQLKESDIPE